MEHADIRTYMEIGSMLMNGAFAWVTLRLRAEISELKVWILENFERREK